MVESLSQNALAESQKLATRRRSLDGRADILPPDHGGIILFALFIAVGIWALGTAFNVGVRGLYEGIIEGNELKVLLGIGCITTVLAFLLSSKDFK